MRVHWSYLKVILNGVMVFAHQLVHLLIGMQELAGCPDLYKNTVDAWFREMAQETQKIYEAVESLKATLKAKGLF